VSYSGGKDSTAMLMMMLDKNMPIDEIVFCEVIAFDNVGAEFEEMHYYIRKVENYIKKKITIVNSGITFEEQFYTEYKRGKRKGKIYGFPHTLGAWCTGRLKMKALNKYFNSLGEHIRYIGIAYDEPVRYNRLSKNERAPLFEWQITERQAKTYLLEKDLLNPLYSKFNRLGCWFCPKQPLYALKIIREQYPEYWSKMLEWEKDSPVKFKPNYTLEQLEHRFKTEDMYGKQLSIFDE
jgi:3'-phosphoadenosine 5'-phosphosulfate sulfotransferase (PAPS reductase)/FAD synthetase